MTERELDDILREGLIIINTPECLALPDEPFPTSEKFERKMAKLRANPNRYLRKLKRAARPLWRKVLSTAAAVLVVLSLSLGAVMAVSPTARAWVQKVVVQWLEEYVGFQFRGDGVYREGIWGFTWLPEGFHEVSATYWDGCGRVTYENQYNTKIFFDYRPVVDGNQLDIDREHSVHYEEIVSGKKATIFVANEEGKNTFLIWTDDDQTIAFRLMGDVDDTVLLNMAENAYLN